MAFNRTYSQQYVSNSNRLFEKLSRPWCSHHLYINLRMICLYIDSICVLSFVSKQICSCCLSMTCCHILVKMIFLCFYLIRSRIICLFPKSIINA
jgi:hypothetical protein